MTRITLVPGAVGPGASQALPSGAPQIRSVVSATITRLPASLGDHPPGDIVACLLAHAVHAHPLVVGAAAVAAPYGASAGGNDVVDGAGELIPGAGATGVQDNAAVQAHAATAAVVAHAGANPTVAAVPTKVDDTHFSIDVACLVGDVLTLVYNEVGEFVRAS